MRLPVLLEAVMVEVEVLQERVVNEARGDVELDVKIPLWQQADIINSNRRRYRRELLQREIGKITERINGGDTVWGHPFHPADGMGKSDEISHKWTKVWMNDDGRCEGTLTILPTTSGKNIQTLVRAGKLGLSSRGFGTVTEKEEEIDGKKTKFLDVNNDYSMAVPGDWVVFPSVKGAGTCVEAISLLESELNKGLDLIKNENKICGDGEMKLEQLKKDHPELVKQIEDEKEKALEAEAQKSSENKDTEVAELKKQISEKDTKITELENEIKGLKETREKTLGEVRELISSASDIDGVLPESNPDDEPSDNKGLEAELAEVKKSLEEEKAKITKLENEKKKKEDEEKAEADAVKLQSDLKEKLDATLAKDGYKAYAELIEKDLVKDGKIVIESVDAVEADVKAAFERINEIRASEVKGQILSGGLAEKGRIADPEGGSLKDERKPKLIALYKQTKLAGFKGSYDEWEKQYPKLVESVK